MKLVINQCYGGFGLSPKGIKRYLELKGKECYCYIQSKYKYSHGIDEFIRVDDLEKIDTVFFYCTTYNQGYKLTDPPENIFRGYDIKRNDPILVQLVEELGREASKTFSNLVVVEIENGRWYKINEYDGYESIEYRDIDDEWELAED